MIKGFLLLTGLYLCGEGLQYFFGLALPGGVIGMGILTALLVSGTLDVKHVETAAQLLLDNMSLFFVPAGVGLILYFELIAMHWLAIVLITVVSFVAVLAATGIVTQALGSQERRQDHDRL